MKQNPQSTLHNSGVKSGMFGDYTVTTLILIIAPLSYFRLTDTSIQSYFYIFNLWVALIMGMRMLMRSLVNNTALFFHFWGSHFLKRECGRNRIKGMITSGRNIVQTKTILGGNWSKITQRFWRGWGSYTHFIFLEKIRERKQRKMGKRVSPWDKRTKFWLDNGRNCEIHAGLEVILFLAIDEEL